MADVTALSQGASRTIGNALVLTGSVQSLPTVPYTLAGLAIQSKSTNSGVIDLVDTADGNVIWQMVVGSYVSLDIGNTRAIRVRGTANDVIYWVGLIV